MCSMRYRRLGPVFAVPSFVALRSFTSSMVGQTPATRGGASKTGAAPRTAWGEPDLQGTWFVMYDVPLERSAADAKKEFLTDAEVAAADAAKGVNPGRNSRGTEGTAQDVSGAYNAVFNSVLKTGR